LNVPLRQQTQRQAARNVAFRQATPRFSGSVAPSFPALIQLEDKLRGLKAISKLGWAFFGHKARGGKNRKQRLDMRGAQGLLLGLGQQLLPEDVACGGGLIFQYFRRGNQRLLQGEGGQSCRRTLTAGGQKPPGNNQQPCHIPSQHTEEYTGEEKGKPGKVPNVHPMGKPQGNEEGPGYAPRRWRGPNGGKNPLLPGARC